MTILYNGRSAFGGRPPEPFSTEVTAVLIEDPDKLKISLVDFHTQRHVADDQMRLFRAQLSEYLKQLGFESMPAETMGARLVLVIQHEIEMHRMNHPFRQKIFAPVKRIVYMGPELNMDVSAAKAALAKFQKG